MQQSLKYSIFILILTFIFHPSIMFAQYYGETVTEKSFEQSDHFFKSHFLNPLELQHFREVAVGLLNNPFPNLYVNPANLSSPDTSGPGVVAAEIEINIG